MDGIYVPLPLHVCVAVERIAMGCFVQTAEEGTKDHLIVAAEAVNNTDECSELCWQCRTAFSVTTNGKCSIVCIRYSQMMMMKRRIMVLVVVMVMLLASNCGDDVTHR